MLCVQMKAGSSVRTLPRILLLNGVMKFISTADMFGLAVGVHCFPRKSVSTLLDYQANGFYFYLTLPGKNLMPGSVICYRFLIRFSVGQ